MNLTPKEKDEVSQIIETHKAESVGYVPPPSASEIVQDWKQTIAMLLTVVAMAVGAALWASNAHADIKEWTTEQDFVTQKELKEIIKEQYVKKEDFVIVKEKLENNEKQHVELQKTLDKLSEKLDIIRGEQIRGRRGALRTVDD